MIFIVFEIIFFAVLLAGDLVAKHYVMPFLVNQTGFKYVLIDKVLTLRYSLNDGAGFGFLSGKTTLLEIMTITAMVAILLFTVFLHLRNTQKTPSGRFLLVTLSMIMAGGIGNLVDRIAFGEVRDFIDYTIVETLFHRSFAICNLADVWLTVGMIFLIVYVLFMFKEKKSVSPVEPPDDEQEGEDAVSVALDMYENRNEQNK